MVHYVYQIIHKWSGRRYVGVRSCDGRPEEDIGIKYFSSSRDKAFIEEQRMFKHKFNYEVLEEFDTREAAIKREIEIHDFCDIANNPDFYNKAKQTSTGFTGGVGKNSSVSVSVYNIDPITGYILTHFDTIRQAELKLGAQPASIMSSCKDYTKTAKGFVWCLVSLYNIELRQKIINHKYFENPKSKKVYQIQLKTGKIAQSFSCIGKAAKNTGINPTGIILCCQRKQKTAGGYHWGYQIDYNMSTFQQLNLNKSGISNSRSKSIYQIDPKTNEVLEQFSSANIAAKELGLHQSNITDCARGRYKTSGGYKWEYSD